VLAVSIIGLGAYLHARNTAAPIDSIAVLPFDNQNHSPETEYLSDGVTESIINILTQLPGLRVIARNSAFRYKGKEMDPTTVGRELGGRAVLTGRLLQRGESLIVGAELVDVRDNKQVWGQQYNRKLADVFALQEEIAKEISEKLRLKLSSAERQQLAKRPTENLKAFQYYMQGRAYIQRRTREDLLTAVRYYEQALEEDRNYALAYAGLADAYGNLGGRGYFAPLEGRRKMEEAARKALALDENLAEAHAALSYAHGLFAPYNFSVCDRELRRAIELSPSLAMAHQYLGISLTRQGRLDEGLAEFLKARELDPLSSVIARQVALPYYLKRDYGRALELLRQANDLGPAFTTPWEIGVYIQNGLFNEPLADLEKAKRERKNDPILIYSTGMVYAAQGKRAEALQIIKGLEAMSGASLDQAHYIAKTYAVLNEKELALSWLERGLAAGALGGFLEVDPVWDTIRSDPRFPDLLRRMGVPQ
jgi:TolB-like protein/lipoprotein NlpI